MKYNKSLIDEIIKAISPLPSDLGVILYDDFEEEDEMVEFENIYETIKNIDKDAKLYYGMSKMVIKSPNFGGVVIKIPFKGYYTAKLEDDDWMEHAVWYPFTKANTQDHYDYCIAEYEKYIKAKTFDLECFFAKTIYYDKIENTRFFLQEEITPSNSIKLFEPVPTKPSKEYILRDQKGKNSIPISNQWLANAIDCYGEGKTSRFLYYCRKVDPDLLNDAHYANYGYRSNGEPAFLDFSGYADI